MLPSNQFLLTKKSKGKLNTILRQMKIKTQLAKIYGSSKSVSKKKIYGDTHLSEKNKKNSE